MTVSVIRDMPRVTAAVPRGNWSVVAHSLLSSRLAIVGGLIIVTMCCVAILAPWIVPYDPTLQGVGGRLEAPSLQHLLGTDEFGRDVLSRVIAGAQVSLSIAAAAVLILTTIGVLLGALGGYHGGVVDAIIMRVVDMMMSVPSFFLLITVVAIFGASLINTMLVIGLTSWMATARLVRAQFLSIREREFVEAVRASGASNWRIILHHILPNTVDVIIVQATLYISLAILLETGLSYLGLGAQPPTPSWGNMLSSGRTYMRSAWWVTTFPGLAIFLSVLSFNFVGDALRDAFDPRLGRR
jgi:peptide/nickel transport system permease protein